MCSEGSCSVTRFWLCLGRVMLWRISEMLGFFIVSLDLMFTLFFFPLYDTPAEGSAPLLLSH